MEGMRIGLITACPIDYLQMIRSRGDSRAFLDFLS